MLKYRISAVFIVILAVIILLFVQRTETEHSQFPFRYGLDLSGGSHLVFEADTTGLERGEISGAMNSLREVIERRVNIFGVSEPIVQVESGGLVGESERLIVELPGVTDLKEAVAMIGRTPLLEFKLAPVGTLEDSGEIIFEDTGLTGRLLERSTLDFDQVKNDPVVLLSFNPEGRELFSKITKENVGRILAIFLDGEVISAPVIREEIRDGRAQISGGFTPIEARELVRDLNFGALPVPIELVSTQSVGPSLGEKILQDGVQAAFWGFVLVVAFLIFWYRLPGVLAILALSVYVLVMLALFKFIPVTITAAGIAGFILSIGMAVDANILIFERMKEELKAGKNLGDSIKSGFKRAWFSIRDSNISSVIIAIILFWFGSSLIKGFALIFGIGVLVSMLSAILVTRTFLLSVVSEKTKGNFLFGSGPRM